MTSEPALLAIDIGSSSVRCRLYGPAMIGTDCGDASVARYRWRTAGGAMEVDARDLLDRTARVIDAGVAKASQGRQEIVGVAVTTFWHSLVGVDAGGEPTTPVLAWGDARAAGAAQELRARLDPDDYHRRTGCYLHSSYPLAKLLWLRSAHPESFGGAAVWGSFAAFLEWSLFGSPRASVSIASGSGLLNGRTLDWDAGALDAAGVPASKLPPLTDLEPRIGLRPEWARRWPALAAIPWYPALGDGGCANVGVGAVGADRPGITVGTSAAVRVVEREGLGDAPADLWSYRLDRSYRVTGGALSNGGNGLAYLLARYRGVERPEIDQTLRDAEPDRHGLTIIPSLVPERDPAWTDTEPASIVGLTPSTEPRDVVVAWVEAASQRMAELVRRLEARYGRAAELRATGGALHAVPGWLQTIADACGRPVRLGGDREATCRGAAIVAARELGWIARLEDAGVDPEGARTAAPVPSRQVVHGAALERQHRVAQAIERALADPLHGGASRESPEPDPI